MVKFVGLPIDGGVAEIAFGGLGSRFGKLGSMRVGMARPAVGFGKGHRKDSISGRSENTEMTLLTGDRLVLVGKGEFGDAVVKFHGAPGINGVAEIASALRDEFVYLSPVRIGMAIQAARCSKPKLKCDGCTG